MRCNPFLPGLLLLAASAAAATTPTPGIPEKTARAELLADTSGVQPGQSFTVGVLLKIEPGWHIYWKNPGDAGLATSVGWSVPPGFTAGELRWPVPEAWNQPGNIVGYGYEGSVLLSAVVQAPAKLDPGSAVALAADVRWLGCRDVCIPGQTRVELELPVSASPQPAHAELFDAWAKNLPIQSSDPASPFTVKSTGALATDAERGNFMLLLQWKTQPTEVTWFPAPEAALKIESMSLQTQEDNTQVTFTGSVLPGQKLTGESLESLIVYNDAQGVRRGVLVPVQLRGSTAPPAQ